MGRGEVRPRTRVEIFGKPVDGFSSYPGGNYQKYYLGRADDRPEWILEARKRGGVLEVVFVRYTVRESKTGREGACFGIALKVEGRSPIRLGDVRARVFERAIDAFVESGFLLGRGREGALYFLPRSFEEVGERITGAIRQIEEVAANWFRVAPALGENTPDGRVERGAVGEATKEDVLRGVFERFGVVRIASNAPELRVVEEERRERGVAAARGEVGGSQVEAELAAVVERIEGLAEEMEACGAFLRRAATRLSRPAETYPGSQDEGRPEPIVIREPVETEDYWGGAVAGDRHGEGGLGKPWRRLRKPARWALGLAAVLVVVVLATTAIVMFRVSKPEAREQVDRAATTRAEVDERAAPRPSARVEPEFTFLPVDDFLGWAADSDLTVRNTEDFILHVVEFVWEQPGLVAHYRVRSRCRDFIVRSNSERLSAVSEHIRRNLEDPAFRNERAVPIRKNRFWRDTIMGEESARGFRVR